MLTFNVSYHGGCFLSYSGENGVIGNGSSQEFVEHRGRRFGECPTVPIGTRPLPGRHQIKGVGHD